MPYITGGSSSSVGGTKRYLNKPAGNITVTSTTIAAFSTAWQITGVAVAASQNVILDVSAHMASSGTNDRLVGLFRGSTQLVTWNWSNVNNLAMPFRGMWVDENPGAGTYTYEVRAANFVAGTITVYQTSPTTDTTGGSSVFMAQVYTP